MPSSSHSQIRKVAILGEGFEEKLFIIDNINCLAWTVSLVFFSVALAEVGLELFCQLLLLLIEYKTVVFQYIFGFFKNSSTI